MVEFLAFSLLTSGANAHSMKTNGAKAQSPRLFHVFIYEDLTRCIFLFVKFRKKNQAMHLKPANQNFYVFV